MRYARNVARMGEVRNEYRVLVRKAEGKSSVTRPRCRREDNIKMNLKKYGVRSWIGFNWLSVVFNG
jgi:hypothetical protein